MLRVARSDGALGFGEVMGRTDDGLRVLRPRGAQAEFAQLFLGLIAEGVEPRFGSLAALS